jgi:NAD(P)-dependent dehydrogenase (short-subunit alcohol dehydrogenase family)
MNSASEPASQPRLTALVTGGSRGIGAATAIALAELGYDVAITYRNKAARAQEVAAEIERRGGRSLAIPGDITLPADVRELFALIARWATHLDSLVLNASGGLEREALAADPDYPLRINRDAQVALLDGALPLMTAGGAAVFVTSHWAHLHGQVEQLPAYEAVAASKHAGEQAIRARQAELAARGIRLAVVTGDLIEGTITPKLLERAAPGLAGSRRANVGELPSAREMGEAIAQAATDAELPTGTTLVVGGALDSLRA